MQAYRKMFEMQSEILKLNEQNMELESRVRIVNVENEGLKKGGSRVLDGGVGMLSSVSIADAKKSDFANNTA